MYARQWHQQQDPHNKSISLLFADKVFLKKEEKHIKKKQSFKEKTIIYENYEKYSGKMHYAICDQKTCV